MSTSLKVAFIAKYAPPVNSVKPVAAVAENAVYSQYHFDIYSILKKRFPNLVTGTNATYIMENSKSIDYIFSLLNRAPYRNSEIFISSLAEYYGIPYLGGRPNIRALAEDKHLAKVMAEHCGLRTAKWVTFDVGESITDKEPFAGPYFVKPRYGASSKFIDENSICYTWNDVKERTRYLHLNNEDAIVEEFIDGIYYSSPIICQKGVAVALPPIREESELKGNVVTYGQKRKVETGLIRTVETDQDIVEAIRRASNLIAFFIRPFDYTRVDYIFDGTNLYFLEFNMCCNLGRQSAFTQSAEAAGIKYDDLILSILDESLNRQGIC